MATSVDSLSIQITASTKAAKTRVDELCESLDKLVTAINALDVSKFETLSNSVNTLSSSLSGLKGTGVRQIKRVAEGLAEVEAKKNVFDPIKEGAEKVTTATEGMARSAEQVKEEMGSFQAKPLDEIAEASDRASASMSRTETKMSAFKSLLAGLKIIIPTEGLEKVENRIGKLQERIADLRDKMAYNSQINPDYVNSKEMEKDQQQIQGLINELDRLKLKKQELESHGGFKFNSFGQGISNLHGKIASLNKDLSGFVSKLHHSKSAARSAAKSNAEFKLSADRLVKSLTRVTKMLKLMITRMALRTVIKETGNGFKSLALHSEEFNQAMSGLINGSKKLAYSFAGMVGPLINALAPALIYVINLLVKFMNIINQVFSTLAGKGTYSKTKDFATNWADDIQAANKSAKELKKTVLGFDELNQLTDKQTSGGDTSNNIVDMFEDAAIESKWADLANYIKNLAKRLFDPIKKAWDKVGDFVKKSWKYAMDEVLKLGESVARDFWKVWEQADTQKIFENILKTIGWIGQAVGNLAKRFREAWDKNDTGLHILEKIRDIILIITNHIESMAKKTAEWADNLDFSPILTKFDEWLGSIKPVIDNLMGIVEDFYEKVILPLGKWAVEEGGPQLLQVFIDFNNKVDWEGLREKLRKLWEHLEPFMERVGEGLIIFIDRVSQSLANFVNSKGFEDFLKAVENWMDKVDPEEVADGLEAICKAIIGFVAVKSVISALEAVTGFLALLAKYAPLLKVAIVVTVAVEGLEAGKTIGSIIFPDDKELYEHYKGVTGSLEMLKDFVVALYDSIGMIVSKAWEQMTSYAKVAFDIYKLLFTGNFSAKEFALDLNAAAKAGAEFNNFIQGIEGEDKVSYESFDAFERALKGIGTTADETADKTQGISDKFKEMAEKSGKASVELGKMENPLGKVKENADSFKVSFDGASESIKKVTDNTPVLTEKQKDLEQAFKNTAAVTPSLTSSQKKIEESLKGVATETTNLKDVTVSSWTDIDSEVANAQISMSGTLNEVSLNTETASDDIIKSTDKIKDAFSEDNWTFEGIGEGLTKSFKKAKEGIKGVWNSIADKLNGEYEVGESKFKIKLPKFYATGGFPSPEDGWFRAGHGEMIGKFDNGQSVVANNQQIVEGISQGVYSAVSAAMAQNSGNSGYIANTIVVDGEVIARTITKAQNKQNMRYSPSTV